eukprot:1446382-Rhodomonas_salina.2
MYTRCRYAAPMKMCDVDMLKDAPTIVLPQSASIWNVAVRGHVPSARCSKMKALSTCKAPTTIRPSTIARACPK